MRRMGALRTVLPFTYICFLIGSLAIMGFPFLTGFYSKDLILEFAYSRFIVDSTFIYFLGLVSAIFTAIYSLRLIFFAFSEKKPINSYYIYFKYFMNNLIESPVPMFISMFILCFASIFIGYIFHDLLLGAGSFYWNTSIFVLPQHFSFIDSEFIHPLVKNLPVLFSLLAMYLTWLSLWAFQIGIRSQINLFWIYSDYLYPIWYQLASFSYHAGFFNTIYNYIFLQILQISYVSTNKYLDKGLFEYLGPFGFYKVFRYFYYLFEYSRPLVIFFSIFFMFICSCMFCFYWIISISWMYIIFLKYLGLLPICFLFTVYFNLDHS